MYVKVKRYIVSDHLLIEEWLEGFTVYGHILKQVIAPFQTTTVV